MQNVKCYLQFRTIATGYSCFIRVMSCGKVTAVNTGIKLNNCEYSDGEVVDLCKQETLRKPVPSRHDRAVPVRVVRDILKYETKNEDYTLLLRSTIPKPCLSYLSR